LGVSKVVASRLQRREVMAITINESLLISRNEKEYQPDVRDFTINVRIGELVY